MPAQPGWLDSLLFVAGTGAGVLPAPAGPLALGLVGQRPVRDDCHRPGSWWCNRPLGAGFLADNLGYTISSTSSPASPPSRPGYSWPSCPRRVATATRTSFA